MESWEVQFKKLTLGTLISKRKYSTYEKQEARNKRIMRKKILPLKKDQKKKLEPCVSNQVGDDGRGKCFRSSTVSYVWTNRRSRQESRENGEEIIQELV